MEEQNLFELIGSVEQIIYRNEKNGYTVLELLTENETTTAVGIMPYVSVGEEVRLIGSYKTHQNFGLQFVVKACERHMPSTSAAILKYLSSGAIRGIGPATAKRLVEMFGENTLTVMREEPERLQLIRGITRAKAQKIAEELQNMFGIRETMISLGEYGILPEEALRIYKVYGAQSLEIVKENPYIICEEPIGIGFDRADGIASSMQRPADDVLRVRAALLYILRHNMRNGHTCLPEDKFLDAAVQFLRVPKDYAQEVLNTLKEEKVLQSDVFSDKEFLFIPEMYRSETYIASRLSMMLRFPARPIVGADQQMAAIQQHSGIKYASLQKQAITDALKKGMLVLTGGPGTGKTTTLSAIMKILETKGEKVFLAAPTGRAAQRMSEVTNREAKTIHRMLEVEWNESDKPSFKRNEKNLLECDALILDELSMVDAVLFEGVLRALPLGCRLILVGDSDQLPCVGAGNVLGDLVHSRVLPVVQLTEIFRQSMKSLIVTNAHRIVNGELPELSVKDNDFFFLDRFDPTMISMTIVELLTKRLPASYGYSPLFDIQVLCPGRKGTLGTIQLNEALQKAINPYSESKKEISIGSAFFREGDKVMQIKNNYDIPWAKEDGTVGEGVFNGDVGILLEIDRVASTLTVQFDDKTAVYEMESASDLELAYAITVHKSQGNEFEAVVMPMFYGAPQLYYRNLLYTAVTRAKTMLIMVGTRDTVKRMVENDRKAKRYSGLYHFLSKERDE